MKLYSHKSVREIKNRHGFKSTKSLGQNFLTDKNIIDNIMDSTNIGEDDLVIEIGPGLGVLTVEAAQRAGKVIAIEIDKGLLPILEDTLGEYPNVTVINKDVLKTNLREIIENAREADPKLKSVKIIGNLPYYITTPIIMKILEEDTPADSITVMMQKEVADRIMASPGNRTYGALSVVVQYYCNVTAIASVPKEVFVPVPKVDSTVLRLDIREEKPVRLLDEKMFFACIKAGFGKRRKTLLNTMTGMNGMEKEEMREMLWTAGIDPIRRAETLTIEEFATLANCISRGMDVDGQNQGIL